ncbi:hypothetical protein OKA04_09045 [Luteolibacter flavescens]|uniref:Uncharacterized protein n=1 Tax=Luteolibacter flavescens TaxID=1859460 RepID=A0ABT3FMS4_9BACT|nr:hypothetical protein [Luteolibacter flavescens]MCW1884873.1 hypothetical protein [Luteolibacter flavescens]
MKAPRIDDHGQYAAVEGGRTIRVFTSIDNRLMLGDFHAKIAGFAAKQPPAGD